MDIAISALRADLSTWINHVKGGGEVVITDRGTPVVRMIAVGTSSLIDQLTDEGVISRPSTSDKPDARTTRRIKASGPVSELIGQHRR